MIRESRQVKRTKYAGKTEARTVDKKAIMAYKEKLEKEKQEKEEMERIRALYSSESDEENALCNKLRIQSKVVKRDYEKERKENEERTKRMRVEEQEKKEIDAAMICFAMICFTHQMMTGTRIQSSSSRRTRLIYKTLF